MLLAAPPLLAGPPGRRHWNRWLLLQLVWQYECVAVPLIDRLDMLRAMLCVTFALALVEQPRSLLLLFSRPVPMARFWPYVFGSGSCKFLQDERGHDSRCMPALSDS